MTAYNVSSSGIYAMESLTAGMVQMKKTVRLSAMKVPNRLKGVLGVTEFNLFISNIDFNGFSCKVAFLKR